MFFTQEDYLKIEKWLKARAIKDSQFPELTDYDQPNPDDYFVILQGNKTNAKVKVTKAFLHIYNGLQNRPILRGSGNYSLITDSKWTTRPNEASGEGSIAIGLGNNKASKYLSVAIGQNNIVDSQFSWGLGSDNNIQSVDGYNKVFGNNNIINRGSRNYIIGDNNNLEYSSYNYIFGLNNHISDSNSSAVIIGSDNYGSDGGSSIYIGKGLEGTANDGIASINLGQYNINVSGNNYLFTIGNGKDGNRSNIFSIGYNGDINIQNIGSKTLQAYLKDLETSKQNKLIAGAGIEISSNNTISCTLDPVIFVVVDTLPLVPEDTNINKIHLVKDTTVSGNLYSEYLYVNNTWEKLGDFQPSVDLSNYIDKTSNQTIGGTKTFDKLVKVKNLTIISQQDNAEGSNISLELQDDIEIDPFLANVLSLGDSRYGTPCRVVIPLWKNGLKSLVPIYPSEVITNSYLYYNYAKLDRENIFTNNIVIKSSNDNGDALIIVDDNKHILSLLNKDVFKLDVSQRLLFQDWNKSTSYIISIYDNKINFEHDGLPVSLNGIATPTTDNDAANKQYVDDKYTALDSRTPVDSGISFLKPWEFFLEYSEDVQDVQNYILAGFLQINNQMTSVDGLFNHIRDNNLAGKVVYFTLVDSPGYPSSVIIGNIDTGAVGYKISFSTISRYSDNTGFNNRLIFFEIEIGNLTGDGIIIMNSRLMNIRIKDTLSKIDNNTSNIQTLETKNTELTNTITELESRVTNAVQITYSDLKSLRDGGKLVSGQQYRITDYTCTTTQPNTKSAGHVFDIIVTADDESTLNEVARAVKHDGDAYFANSNLSAWQLWYCLDNDTTRFAWADATNGKGVIYRMIDEFNNDCPYDFKNIQFKHPNDATTYSYYTFASSNVEANTDNSLSITNNCYSNIIKKYMDGDKRRLNCIIFIGSNCHSNTFGSNCHSNTFGSDCYYNTFGSNCHSNTFGSNCHSNTFASSFSNTFGSNCHYNTFASSYYNTFGSSCRYNTFGHDCFSNTFGSNCYYNTFGSNCHSNTFGSNCHSNTFGSNCSYIKFASDSSASTKYNYYRFNHFGDGCQYIVFKGAETASSSAQVQNYNFAKGLQGNSSSSITIDGVRNRAYETKVAKNSNGEIKIYCEADLIL